MRHPLWMLIRPRNAPCATSVAALVLLDCALLLGCVGPAPDQVAGDTDYPAPEIPRLPLRQPPTHPINLVAIATPPHPSATASLWRRTTTRAEHGSTRGYPGGVFVFGFAYDPDTDLPVTVSVHLNKGGGAP